MTQKEWERELLSHLNGLPKEEKKKAIEYYREMFEDKQDSGLEEEEILREFGFPSDCAKRILAEREDDDEDEKKTTSKKRKKWTLPSSPAEILGLVLISLIIVLPLASVLLSIVAGLAACLIGVAIVAVAGVFYFVYAPFMAIHGLGFGAVISYMGAGLIACGVGVLLTIGFYFAIKYAIRWSLQLLKFIYVRRKTR